MAKEKQSKVRKREEVRKRYVKHHMAIPWHDYAVSDDSTMAVDAGLTEKSSIIGRVGLIMLSCGTGAWRVRSSMNIIAEVLGVTCTVDIGLVSLEYTCMDGSSNDTQALDLKSTGVNTHKLSLMEDFVVSFEEKGKNMSVRQIHTMASRRGEERYVAQALAQIGVPIVRTINGDGLFEGANGMWIDRHTCIVSTGCRCNKSGYDQVVYELNKMGVEVYHMQQPYSNIHIDGLMNAASDDLILAHVHQFF